MYSNYKDEFMSEEISKLVSDFEHFSNCMIQKDSILSAVKYMYLNTSNNN